MRKHAPPKATLPDLLYECQEKFGKIFRLYTFTTPLVVTAEAQIARYILGKPKLFGVSKMFGRAFGALVPNGMLIIEGDQWKRTQHTCTHPRLAHTVPLPSPPCCPQVIGLL